MMFISFLMSSSLDSPLAKVDQFAPSQAGQQATLMGPIK